MFRTIHTAEGYVVQVGEMRWWCLSIKWTNYLLDSSREEPMYFKTYSDALDALIQQITFELHFNTNVTI